MRGRFLVALVILALLGLVPTGAIAAAPPPVVGPTTAVAGEAVTVRGTLPTRGRRPVVVQRKQGARWVTLARGRSNARGKIAIRTPARAMTVRLRAPRDRGRRAWTSRPRTFRPAIAVPRLVAGAADADVSASGRYVAFSSTAGDPAGRSNVFVWDRTGGSVRQITYVVTPGDADGDSYEPSISADGLTVAFRTDATNLVPGGDTNPYSDVVTWEHGQSFSWMSVDDAGAQVVGQSSDPSISDDGRTVAFESDSALEGVDGNGRLDVYVRFRDDNKTALLSGNTTGGSADGSSTDPVVSGDGFWVAYATTSSDVVDGDTNGVGDVVRISLYAPSLRLVSRGGNAASLAPSISYDGRRVAYATDAANLAAGARAGVRHVVVWDAGTGRSTLVSRPTGSRGDADSGATAPAISDDGGYVAFVSFARNLAPGDTRGRLQAYVRNLSARVTTAASVTRTGRFGDRDTQAVSIDRTGRYVAVLNDGVLETADVDAVRSVYLVDRRSRP